MAKGLVVFYSRTGTTRRLASAVAAEGGWDLAELFDTCDRSGVAGFARSCLDRALGVLPRLEAIDHTPSSYDFIVLGTPVWLWSVSSPVLAYLMEHRHALPDLAFFATFAGAGAPRAMRQMAHIVGKTPLAELALSEPQIRADHFGPDVRRFVSDIQAALGRRPTPPPPLRRAAPTQQPTNDAR